MILWESDDDQPVNRQRRGTDPDRLRQEHPAYCHAHNKIEVGRWRAGFRRCSECGHRYGTAFALRLAHLRVVWSLSGRLGLLDPGRRGRSPGGRLRRLRRARTEPIYICAHCTHDF